MVSVQDLWELEYRASCSTEIHKKFQNLYQNVRCLNKQHLRYRYHLYKFPSISIYSSCLECSFQSTTYYVSFCIYSAGVYKSDTVCTEDVSYPHTCCSFTKCWGWVNKIQKLLVFIFCRHWNLKSRRMYTNSFFYPTPCMFSWC